MEKVDQEGMFEIITGRNGLSIGSSKARLVDTQKCVLSKSSRRHTLSHKHKSNPTLVVGTQPLFSDTFWNAMHDSLSAHARQDETKRDEADELGITVKSRTAMLELNSVTRKARLFEEAATRRNMLLLCNQATTVHTCLPFSESRHSCPALSSATPLSTSLKSQTPSG